MSLVYSWKRLLSHLGGAVHLVGAVALLFSLSVGLTTPLSAQTKPTEIRFRTSLEKGAKLRIFTEPYNQATIEGLRKGDFWGEYFVENPQNEVVIRGEITLLECFRNQITELKIVSAPKLVNLKCYENQIPALDLTNAPLLNYLDCHKNKLQQLNLVSNTALERLICSDNQLTQLGVDNCSALVRLECGNNQLSSLNLTKATLLEDLHFQNNKISALNLAKNTRIWGIKMFGNLFDAAKMKAFIQSLPEAYANPAYLYIVDTRNLNEKNQCSMANVATLQGKGWAPYDHFGGEGSGLPYLGDDYQPQVGNQRFEITTALSAGEKITLDIASASGDILIDGVQEKAPFSGKMTLTVKDKEIVIRGALKSIVCSGNRITALRSSGNTALETIDCSNNQIQTLDLSHHTALKTLSCQQNKIQQIDLSDCPALIRVNVYLNRLMAQNMTRFIESLRSRVGNESDPLLFLVDSKHSTITEENIALKADIQKAKEKGWRVKDYINGATWGMGTDYLGQDATYHSLRITQGEHGSISVVGITDLTHILHGTEIRVEAKPQEGWQLAKIRIGSQEIGAQESFLLVQDTEIQGIFEQKPQTPETYIAFSRPEKGLMSLTLKVEGDASIPPMVEGASLKGWNGQQLTIETTGQPVRVYGQFTEVMMLLTFVNDLDVSHMPMLTLLNCGFNALSTLSLEKNEKLQLLSCEGNGLQKILISNKAPLYYINAYGNKIQGEAMTQLVGQLPNWKGQQTAKLIIVDTSFGEKEQNQCLIKDVQNATAKNWKVFDLNGDPKNMVEYKGFDVAVEAISATDVRIFPNPVAQQMTIQGATARARIDVYSPSGLLVASSVADDLGNAHFECQSWASGVYIVRINQGAVAVRIIKQ